MSERDDSWARTTATVDQTLAALKETEYEILRFRDITQEFASRLLELGLTRIEVTNIIHALALAAIFPEDT